MPRLLVTHLFCSFALQIATPWCNLDCQQPYTIASPHKPGISQHICRPGNRASNSIEPSTSGPTSRRSWIGGSQVQACLFVCLYVCMCVRVCCEHGVQICFYLSFCFGIWGWINQALRLVGISLNFEWWCLERKEEQRLITILRSATDFNGLHLGQRKNTVTVACTHWACSTHLWFVHMLTHSTSTQAYIHIHTYTHKHSHSHIHANVAVVRHCVYANFAGLLCHFKGHQAWFHLLLAQGRLGCVPLC